MTEISQKKYTDLEERTFKFAQDCRNLVFALGYAIGNREDGSQLIRSSGSVAANYIEANEAISPKDFVHRIKICRKEIKESRLWLRLLDNEKNKEFFSIIALLIGETEELEKIFGSILKKYKL